jgi:chromosome segregation ATPase
MGKVIKFPSRKQLKTKDIVDSLKLEIECCEENLKEALEQLEYLNEEILYLNNEYGMLLTELTELTNKEKQ